MVKVFSTNKLWTNSLKSSIITALKKNIMGNSYRETQTVE
jgi:hypothetical protein